jgi:hypothetical protein
VTVEAYIWSPRADHWKAICPTLGVATAASAREKVVDIIRDEIRLIEPRARILIIDGMPSPNIERAE